jgi:hypothetical protein
VFAEANHQHFVTKHRITRQGAALINMRAEYRLQRLTGYSRWFAVALTLRRAIS